MNKRAFITLLGGTATAWAVTARLTCLPSAVHSTVTA